jgi:hypothetical protein
VGGDQLTEHRRRAGCHQPLIGVLQAERAPAPERSGVFGDRCGFQPVVEHRDYRRRDHQRHGE